MMTTVDITEAAECVGVSTQTILRWEEQGHVFGEMKGGRRRFNIAALADMIEFKRGAPSYMIRHINGALPNVLEVEQNRYRKRSGRVPLEPVIIVDEITSLPSDATSFYGFEIDGGNARYVKYERIYDKGQCTT